MLQFIIIIIVAAHNDIYAAAATSAAIAAATTTTTTTLVAAMPIDQFLLLDSEPTGSVTLFSVLSCRMTRLKPLALYRCSLFLFAVWL